MLRYNRTNNEFFLVTTERAKAEEAGLTLSTSARGPHGEPIFFTDSPYAALPFYREADPACQDRLAPLWTKYLKSWASTSPNMHPYGQNAKDLGYTPMGYQNAGVDYALEQDNTIIGDGMGLGKSMQALLHDNARGHEHNLIVCPANVRPSWRNQINLWSVIPNCRVYPIMKGSDGVNPYANYTIVSYELLQNPGIHAALYQQRWDSIHFDEVHYLKTPSAKRTHACYGGGRGLFAKSPLIERAKAVLGLTGTLLPNRPRECFTTVRHLAWQAIDYMTEDEFAYRYNPMGRMENGHSLEAKGRLPELQARLRCNLMVRRLQEDVLKELPDKRYELCFIEPDARIAEVIAKERLLNFKMEMLHDPFAEIWGQISTLRLEMGLAALPRMIEYIKYMLDVEGVEKVGVGVWHNEVMDRLKAALDEKYGVCEVRGGMSPLQKEKSCKEFVSNRDKRIFQGQMIAAGVGIDGLQKVCSHVVLAEPDWVPATNEQFIHRFYRIGQHSNVIARLMCVEGSLLERILGANFTKIPGIHASLDERILCPA